jgi:hypothetical protein
MLTYALVVLACVAGVTGTWSPCGFSMIETIGAPRRRVRTSSATFALGAVAGGAATFTTVALAGELVRSVVGANVVLVAAVLAIAAALAEMRGAAIAPQIRRQVPEHWRRTLPLPLAACLYGALLGLGFTTFVLTFAVWALAGLAFALAAPATGLAIGVAFGVGRALPIVTIAPLLHRRLGARLLAGLGERPAVLRAFRAAGGAALVVAAALLIASQAQAATRLGQGRDPSAAGGAVVWTTAAGGVEIHEGQPGSTNVPADAVLGGSLIAWRDGDTVHVAQASDMTPVVDVSVPGVNALAVSDQWLVTRTSSPSGDQLSVRQISAPTDVRTIAAASSPAQLGRPSLDADSVVYHVATLHGSRIVAYDLSAGKTRVLRRSVAALLINPALLGDRLLYVRQTDLAQLLELGPAQPGARDRAIFRLGAPAVHDSGHEPGASSETRTPHPHTSAWLLWTTALSETNAYVTLLPRRGGAQSRIVSVTR